MHMEYIIIYMLIILKVYKCCVVFAVYIHVCTYICVFSCNFVERRFS